MSLIIVKTSFGVKKNAQTTLGFFMPYARKIEFFKKNIF